MNSKGLYLDSEYDLDTPSRALSYFIVSHINHNINVIAQSSKRICGELLLKDNIDIQEAISEYLEKNESYQENILQLFDAVVIKKGDAISSFKSKIIDLSKSPNYEIRRISQNLCKTSRISNHTKSNFYSSSLLSINLIYLQLALQS